VKGGAVLIDTHLAPATNGDDSMMFAERSVVYADCVYEAEIRHVLRHKSLVKGDTYQRMKMAGRKQYTTANWASLLFSTTPLTSGLATLSVRFFMLVAGVVFLVLCVGPGGHMTGISTQNAFEARHVRFQSLLRRNGHDVVGPGVGDFGLMRDGCELPLHSATVVFTGTQVYLSFSDAGGGGRVTGFWFKTLAAPESQGLDSVSFVLSYCRDRGAGVPEDCAETDWVAVGSSKCLFHIYDTSCYIIPNGIYHTSLNRNHTHIIDLRGPWYQQLTNALRYLFAALGLCGGSALAFKDLRMAKTFLLSVTFVCNGLINGVVCGIAYLFEDEALGGFLYLYAGCVWAALGIATIRDEAKCLHMMSATVIMVLVGCIFEAHFRFDGWPFIVYGFVRFGYVELVGMSTLYMWAMFSRIYVMRGARRDIRADTTAYDDMWNYVLGLEGFALHLDRIDTIIAALMAQGKTLGASAALHQTTGPQNESRHTQHASKAIRHLSLTRDESHTNLEPLTHDTSHTHDLSPLSLPQSTQYTPRLSLPHTHHDSPPPLPPSLPDPTRRSAHLLDENTTHELKLERHGPSRFSGSFEMYRDNPGLVDVFVGRPSLRDARIRSEMERRGPLRHTALRHTAKDNTPSRQRPMNSSHTCITSLDQLYLQASLAHRILLQKVRWWAGSTRGFFPRSCGSGIIAWAEALAHPEQKEQIKFGSIKSVARSIEKASRSYSMDVSRLTDIVRQCIIFQSLKDLCQCLDAVAHDQHVQILRVKNRYSRSYESSESAGYRDCCLNLIVSTPSSRWLQVDTHICELQLVLQQFHEIKSDEGHQRYIAYRNLRAE